MKPEFRSKELEKMMMEEKVRSVKKEVSGFKVYKWKDGMQSAEAGMCTRKGMV